LSLLFPSSLFIFSFLSLSSLTFLSFFPIHFVNAASPCSHTRTGNASILYHTRLCHGSGFTSLLVTATASVV
jgi:hypothetical protein